MLIVRRVIRIIIERILHIIERFNWFNGWLFWFDRLDRFDLIEGIRVIGIRIRDSRIIGRKIIKIVIDIIIDIFIFRIIVIIPTWLDIVNIIDYYILIGLNIDIVIVISTDNSSSIWSKFWILVFYCFYLGSSHLVVVVVVVVAVVVYGLC